MTIIEQIKAKIEWLKSIEYPCDNSQQATGFCDALDRMTDFLPTLEEKSEIPNDLEEAAKELYPYKERYDIELSYPSTYDENEEQRKAFITGAEWQKEQIMSEAVEGEILLTPYPTICFDDSKDYDFKDGQNVRVVVLPKEEERKPTSTSQSKYLEKSDYEFIKNCFENKQCYNCGLRKECEREHPDTYEPIGTCSKWTKE